MAWSLGKLDQAVSRDELIAHVSSLASATSLPLNVDSERCFPNAPGVAEAGTSGYAESGVPRDVLRAALS